jgi:hypothetical protein
MPKHFPLSANCQAVTFLVNRIPRVFIYTREDIDKGDILYIESHENEDTSKYIYVKNKRDLLDHCKNELNISSVSKFTF